MHRECVDGTARREVRIRVRFAGLPDVPSLPVRDHQKSTGFRIVAGFPERFDSFPAKKLIIGKLRLDRAGDVRDRIDDPLVELKDARGIAADAVRELLEVRIKPDADGGSGVGLGSERVGEGHGMML